MFEAAKSKKATQLLLAAKGGEVCDELKTFALAGPHGFLSC